MSKAQKWTKENARHTLKVLGFLAASGALTSVIEFMPYVDLGAWTVVVMGAMNGLLVVVKELLNEHR